MANSLCFARWDKYPASRGHLLIIPFRHTPYFFSMTGDEKEAVIALVTECRELLEREFSPGGYNIGFNVGAIAGQTVMHCHCHVIPRYAGDVVDPRGGLRGVVPWKQMY
jgi:diadenosine tetraphosphate (Ap4A) HIT family hydrolase